jgi:hypothetical protein
VCGCNFGAGSACGMGKQDVEAGMQLLEFTGMMLGLGSEMEGYGTCLDGDSVFHLSWKCTEMGIPPENRFFVLVINFRSASSDV